MHTVSSPGTGHVISPSILRAAVLGRRVSVSPEVAAVMVTIAFGEPRGSDLAALAAITTSRCATCTGASV